MLEINTYEDERKARLVTLDKKSIFNEVDAVTYKYTDASEGSVKVQNAVASDSSEHLDGAIISRLMEYRDSKLRLLLSGFIQEAEMLAADDSIRIRDHFRYHLSLPTDTNDALLPSLADLMHKYIVWGCLFDWFTQLGLVQFAASAYGRQLDDLEKDIFNIIGLEGYEKIPLQPFGPAW